MDTFEDYQLHGGEPSLLANHLGLSLKTLHLLFSRISILESGCWEWGGATRKGYGAIQIRYITPSCSQVHRLCYQLAYGAIPSSVHLHHLVEDGCIGPLCCNPSHLQKTTPAEHVSRLSPASISYISGHRDTCAAGHPYTLESLFIDKNGVRQCRVCWRERAQRHRDKTHPDRPKYKKDPAKFKTHCKRGHALEGENIRIVQTKWGPQKQCRVCFNLLRKEKYAREHGLAT